MLIGSVPGGRLAERIGTKSVLGGSIAANVIASFITPPLVIYGGAWSSIRAWHHARCLHSCFQRDATGVGAAQRTRSFEFAGTHWVSRE